MKRKNRLKSVLAGALVTVALSAPIVVFSSVADPVVAEILFEVPEQGGLVLCQDGSVQLLVNVAVSNTVNCRGASFRLSYNNDYLTPSYAVDTVVDGVTYQANQPIQTGVQGIADSDAFFRQDAALFDLKDADGQPVSVNVFEQFAGVSTFRKFYSQLDAGQSVVDMRLFFDNKVIFDALDAADGQKNGKTSLEGAGKLTLLHDVSYNEDDTVYVFNKLDWDKDFADTNQDPDKVVLGQLSFRVKEGRLAEVIDLFDGLKVDCNYGDPAPAVTPARPEVTKKLPGGGNGKSVNLVDVDVKQLLTGTSPWQVAYYDGEQFRMTTHNYNTNTPDDIPGAKVREHYEFHFQRDLIVDVALTNPDFTINAYQNFTTGAYPDDLTASMERWAGMVTVTYADGTKENQPFPWGRTNTDHSNGYTHQYITKDSLAAGQSSNLSWAEMTPTDITQYDPTANVANPGVGTDYLFTQKYQLYQTDANGDYARDKDGNYIVTYEFPVPVAGHMRVTPIQVVDVTAEGLTRSYSVVDVVDTVTTADDLALPTQARIVTDIVPGNVSLVTPIHGWKPTQEGSAWPTGASANLNTLLADSYDADAKKPYWPDPGNSADATAARNGDTQGNFCGDYTFETSTADHQTAQGILKSDIQAQFPWLTVPQEEYKLDNALRRILNPAEYRQIDPKQYVVGYVSTVTETANDKSGESGGSYSEQVVGQPTLTLSVARAAGQGSMANGAVFRVWLPNGQELGTGQNSGGVTVAENWFADPDNGIANPGGHYNGFYYTNYRLQTYNLVTNPGDPAQPAGSSYSNGARETLRRYINLGGWYYVAICENPSTASPVWTEPIPVYVPPRANEYQESKIYNFVGENRGLFHWPGAVGSVMAFPRGVYNVVAPDVHDDPTDTGHIGLPMYEYLNEDGTVSNVTTATGADADAVFDNNDPYTLRANARRHSASYGVATTYDGQTGAQPGEIFTVKVDAAVTDRDKDWKDPLRADQPDAERTHPSVATPVGGAWPAQGDPVTRYGATVLQNEYRVTGFGTVYQPGGSGAEFTYSESSEKTTLRTQLEDVPAQEREKITVTSNAPEGITREAPGNLDNNVTLVTFNTVTQGYTVRQDHLLYINNLGDVDIYGLDIDAIVDGYDLNDNEGRTAPEGGHFEVTMAPASFLPAGTSTPFILTYVYDLRANTDSSALRYRDTLYITSTSHPDAGKGQDNLLSFDAELTVSASTLHQVNVIYRPEEGYMGTAGLIVGEQTGGSGAVMNTTPTTRTYPGGVQVYLEVRKVDEYAVKAITAEIDGQTVDLLKDNAYAGTATLADGTEVYVFEMPNHDVTVYVDFYEPLLSKLRLSEIIDFSAPDGEDLVNDANDHIDGVYLPKDDAGQREDDYIYPVWQKQFQGHPAQGSAAATADYQDAAAWSAAHQNADEDLYLMTVGAAIPATQGGNVYNSSNAHYLVVIDEEDDFSQIKATLRAVEQHKDYRGVVDPADPTASEADKAAYQDGYNLDLKPTVRMTLYYKDQVLDNFQLNNYYTVYDRTHGYGPYQGNPLSDNKPNGDTAGKTQHMTGAYDLTSDQDNFPSPQPGESAYVDIAITGTEDGQSATRHYYVEIHRREAQPQVVLHYGNSPYGMIMNEPKFQGTTAELTDQNRATVKQAFRAGYTFRDAKTSVLPDVVAGKLDRVTYWREAWVRNQGLFEPESLTGFVPATEGGYNLYQNAAGTLFYQAADGKVYTKGADGTMTEREATAQADPLAGTVPVYLPDPAVYKEEDNLDLNDYAFFAILGREMWEPGVVSAKDSSGRDVDLLKIHARALDRNGTDGVTLLDAEATDQVGRFSGTETAVIDLGVAGQKLTPAGGAMNVDPTLGVTQWPVKTTLTTQAGDDGAEQTVATYQVVENIRPGRYLIEYSYYDYDGVTPLTVTRPLVILREVGDVNADGARNAIRGSSGQGVGTDEYQIEDRVTHDPLGYEAGGWDDAEKKETVYPSANIFKFRVADVNNDRNINNIDANQVAKNVKDDKGWLQFYDPVDYGHPGAPITAH